MLDDKISWQKKLRHRVGACAWTECQRRPFTKSKVPPPKKKKQGTSRDGDQAFAWTRAVCQASL